MQKISSFLKHHVNARAQSQISAEVPSVPQDAAFPTEQDFYRHRKQRGVNLGSWFVLERWIVDSPFHSADGPAQSDLDVARGANAKGILERHWDTWITDSDWAWIAERGVNTVRIPVRRILPLYKPSPRVDTGLYSLLG